MGNKIILRNRIGRDSAFGIVYYSYIRDSKIKKLYKFAVKIVANTYGNNVENNILKQLTESVIKNECPHFPILYKTLYCNASTFKNTEIDYSPESASESLSKFKTTKALLPKIVKNALTKKINLIMFINELANGDLVAFAQKYNKDDKLIINAIIQIILSILFYYKVTNSFHKDAHAGNFLFHKIKPGGYFHYRINKTDFYLENLGFLWVIWDFGASMPFTQCGTTYITSDISNILEKINILTVKKDTKLSHYVNSQKSLIHNFLFKSNFKFKDADLKLFINNLIQFLIDNQFFITKKPSNIINTKPYEII